MKNLLFVLILITVNSCALIKRTSNTQDVAKTAIVQSPLIAELEADPTKKVTANYLSYTSNEDQAKSAAMYQAMDQNGCDVILNPIYELKITRKTIDAKVTGICGKYTTLRKPNLEDVTLLQELHEAMPMFDPTIRIVEKRGLFGK